MGFMSKLSIKPNEIWVRSLETERGYAQVAQLILTEFLLSTECISLWSRLDDKKDISSINSK